MQKQKPDYRIIDSKRDLIAAISTLCQQDAYALDTEFHREKTYFPDVALVQIAWRDEIVLIDPLKIDLKPLAELLNSEALAVIHAAKQDLEILYIATSVVPKRIFDTQIAAGFLGYKSASLAMLHERELNVKLAKTASMTDWLKRPLGKDQLNYAAQDVARLLDLHELLTNKLLERKRLDWAEAEFETLRNAVQTVRDPADAWKKIKDGRDLKGESLSVLRAVAAWRESQAQRLNRPSRIILPDYAVASIAQLKPNTLEDLKQIRGIERSLPKNAPAILQAVKKGIADKATNPTPPEKKLINIGNATGIRFASVWTNQVASNEAIDPALLATRADISAHLRGEKDARLAKGWRHKLVGKQLSQLKNGRASLALKGDSIVYERRRTRRKKSN